MSADLTARHGAVQELMYWLEPNPRLPEGPPATVARMIYETSLGLLELAGDGPEMITGLRHLLSAKDCIVRQALRDAESPA